MSNRGSFLQMHHPRRLWRDKVIARGMGSVDLNKAPDRDLHDSTKSFAVWVRVSFIQQISEPAWFLLPDYSVAIQLCLIAMKWTYTVPEHCSFTAPAVLLRDPHFWYAVWAGGKKIVRRLSLFRWPMITVAHCNGAAIYSLS